ncbi:MAG TPA: signal peptidase I [Actinomycetota bacterium]|nr:signal peptidase I [Actinomycetota bacterium]
MRRSLWIAAVTAVVWAVVRPFRAEVAGHSMAPALLPGDWVVGTRASLLRRGDVVVLRSPDGSRDLIKRVVAIPGDVVGERRLESGEYLVAGDNRAHSTDGRTFGPVGRGAIEGVIRFRYWPRPGVIRSRVMRR